MVGKKINGKREIVIIWKELSGCVDNLHVKYEKSIKQIQEIRNR